MCRFSKVVVIPGNISNSVNMRQIKGSAACWNNDECLSPEHHRAVAVVTKTGIVHHGAHVQQKFCCTEPSAASSKHRRPNCSSLHSLHSSVVLSFSFFFSPHPESLLPGGNEGGNSESFLRVWSNVCVCVQMHTSLSVCVFYGRLCDSVEWAVKPEEWVVKERSSTGTKRRVKGSHLLFCPISSPPALRETQQLHRREQHPFNCFTIHRVP